MNTLAPIEIFKPGRHTAMSGAVLEFSESDLQAMVDAYDPGVYDAPITVGHPKLNAPAYGWVGGLSFAEGIVNADPRDVDPEFAELVRQKKFKKVSASLFSPDSPHNPKPGTYYLRHVGFLGAMPPAVKGLKEASFAESDEGIVEFSYGERAAASLFGRLRDFFIEKFGLETADQVIPAWEIDSIKESVMREEMEDRAEAGAMPVPAFSEPQPKGDEMSAEDKARLAALEEENTRLRAEREAQRLAGLHAANVSFAEGLIAEGKLLPGNKATAVATLNMLAQRDEPFEFGEGDDKIAVTADSFKALLASFPKQVEFGEHAAADGDEPGTANFAAPQGYSTDPAALEIHRKALAHQAAHPDASYLDAIQAVSK